MFIETRGDASDREIGKYEKQDVTSLSLSVNLYPKSPFFDEVMQIASRSTSHKLVSRSKRTKSQFVESISRTNR